MPVPEPTPDASLTDAMILAAIERAERHRNPKSPPGISLPTLKEHLGVPHHGGTTRRLRPRLKTLEDADLIEQYRRNGPDAITLTDTGQKRLDAVRGEITLPEAPQHQAWREAQLAAGQRIAGSAVIYAAHWTRPSPCLKPTTSPTQILGSRSASVCAIPPGCSHQQSTACASGPSPTTPTST
jgi:hypothetical protein